MKVTIVCKNDKCFEIVPPSKNAGREREFCNERCRKRYNQRLHYRRATEGIGFVGLRGVTGEGYPVVNRRKPLKAKDAEARVKQHGESCMAPGQWCQAKLHDAYNTKKLCLVRAVFTDDWLELMYAAEGKVHEREMTTEGGMWIDDFKKMQEAREAQGVVGLSSEAKEAEEVKAFELAGGQRKP